MKLRSLLFRNIRVSKTASGVVFRYYTIDQTSVTIDSTAVTIDRVSGNNPPANGGGEPVATDPHWANVSMMLGFDGTEGGTTFTDESPTPKSLTNTEGTAPKTRAAAAKFGATGLDVNAGGIVLGHPGNMGCDFGTGDFTIESWVYPTDVSSQHCIIGNQSTFVAGSWGMYINNGKLRLYVRGGPSKTGVSNVPLNQWSHVAISRVAGVFYLFVNGVLDGSEAASIALDGTTDAYIGRSNYGERFYGYIDELRVTKGVGRYADTFDLPTGPYPRS